jgi:hypothetical protein
MNYEYNGIALIPLITILVDVIKKAGLPNNFAPLVSLVLGVIFGFMFDSNGDVKSAIVTGLIMGMSASGLYSGGKEASKGFNKMRNK